MRKLSKESPSVKISAFRIPRDEWERFRECSPEITRSEQLRNAIKEYTKEHGRK